MYMLAGESDAGKGWGRAGDSFRCLQSLERYGAEAWFQLGDKDLATHLWRSLDLPVPILPMTESYAPTFVLTEGGKLHV